jgi:hypothetical protein
MCDRQKGANITNILFELTNNNEIILRSNTEDDGNMIFFARKRNETTRKTFIYTSDFPVQLIDDTFVLALFSFEAKKRNNLKNELKILN